MPDPAHAAEATPPNADPRDPEALLARIRDLKEQVRRLEAGRHQDSGERLRAGQAMRVDR